MEGNNLHTSVVIELANQDDGDEQKTFKNDFDGMGIPKDYVIDQIFCGENITIYALFEIPEAKNKNSETELLEIQNSTMNDDIRFIHRNSFKKTVQRQSNSHRIKLPVKDDNPGDDDNQQFLFNRCSRKGSFYCLKHLGQNYEIPHREENAELKVLYSKDLILKGEKQMKLKAVSKGVNTDIVQSPKIIEDLQKAINSNVLCRKEDEKAVKVQKVSSTKSAHEINGEGVQQSLSSFSSGTESMKYGMKPSPNFLFVPLLMVEENHFQKVVKSEALPEEKVLETKSGCNKVSASTITEAIDLSYVIPDIYERRESTVVGLESTKPARETVLRVDDEKENKTAKSHLKKKDKVTILHEIRKLQGKLNTLIKSIELNELVFSDDDENVSESGIKTSEEIMKRLDQVLDPQHNDVESPRRNQNRFEDIPIFSPLSFTSASKSTRYKKKATNGDGEERKPEPPPELAKSASSIVLSNAYEMKKPEVKLKNIFSGLKINWATRGVKGIAPSKSDTNSLCSLLLPKYNCIKKSVSFDQRDDKIEIYCLKKIKNSSFKFEGSLKTNLTILQSGEVRLGENLTSLRREMGDEAKIKQRVSKTDSQNFNRNPEQEEIMFLKNNGPNMKKTLNEEEGDAKMVYPNKSLLSQKFVQNPVVHFCRPDAIASDALLKSLKMENQSKPKLKAITKTEEPATKDVSDTEKATTPGRIQKKNTMAEPDVKKEVKPIRRYTKTKPAEKKNEKKESISHEVTKPKSVSGSRKFTVKGTAESKLHVDKLIRTEFDPKYETTNNQKAVKINADEKPGSKNDRLPRPRSQKRELRETPTETIANFKKEMEKKATGKKSDTSAVEADKRTPPEAETKKNVAPRKVAESKKEIPRESEPLLQENPVWLSSNSSSVVVELLSEKPLLEEDFYAEMSQEYGKLALAAGEGNESDCPERTYGSHEKPILKSVWALTKVLLYEDGTKKLEVLEASLTPPGYCLKPEDKNPIENISE